MRPPGARPWSAVVCAVVVAAACSSVDDRATQRELRQVCVPNAAFDVLVHQADRIQVAPAGVVVAPTPYRRAARGARQPVGLVIRNRVVLEPAVDRYWAVGGRSATDLIVFRQSDTPPGLTWAVGGFFPVVLNGRGVVARFPRRQEHAARVAIGVRDRVACVAAVAGRPLGRGMTLAQFERALVAAGYEWALNVDGGRAAYVRTATGGIALGRLRRRGPVLLRVAPSM